MEDEEIYCEVHETKSRGRYFTTPREPTKRKDVVAEGMMTKKEVQRICAENPFRMLKKLTF